MISGLVFDDRYGNTPPFRDAWLPVGMMDAAAFHQVLSNAALNIACLQANELPPETHEAMMHHNKAVQMVMRKMSTLQTSTSDGVIGAIIGFACYAVRPPSLASQVKHLLTQVLVACPWYSGRLAYAHECNQRDRTPERWDRYSRIECRCPNCSFLVYLYGDL